MSDCDPSVAFDEFSLLEPREIEILRKVKCSPLNFLPSVVFKEIWSYMLPMVTNIFNIFLSTAGFLGSRKTSIIRPLLKSKDLDAEQLNSYRPAYNLSFVPKVNATAICKQL